jgi:hypothetical protein
MNKDNPVPSLDKLEKKIIARLTQFDNLVDEAKYNKKLLATFLIRDFQELQNGVETNKEQPFFEKDDKAITFTDVKRLKR